MRKKLNVEGIKSCVVFVTATLTALGSAITGLGAQLAYAPMLSWMLGFSSEKARGSALRFAVIASTASVVAGFAPSLHKAGQLSLGQFLLDGILLFLGATLGALFASPIAPKPNAFHRQRMGMILGVILALFVIVQTAHMTGWNNPHFAQWNSAGALFLMGLGVGGFTQMLGLPSGALMVASLYFWGGFTSADTLALCLFVVALAAVLPALSAAQRGASDAVYATPILLGGVLGGGLGGFVRSVATDKFLLFAFGVVSMFLAARELARLAGEQEPPKSKEAS